MTAVMKTPSVAQAFISSSARSLSFTTTRLVPVGSTLIVGIGTSGTTALPTFVGSDSKNNKWTTVALASSSPVTTFSVLVYSTLTTAIPSGGTITVAISTGDTAPNRWDGTVQEATGLAGTVDVTQVGMQNTANPNVTTPVTSTAGELVVGTVAGPAAAVYTAGSGFTAAPSVVTNAGTIDKFSVLQWKVSGSPGTQIVNGSFPAKYGWTLSAATFPAGGVIQVPTASITVSPNSGLTPLAVTANTNGSSDPQGQSLTFSTNWGDGTVSPGANPKHTYTTAGTFTATLTVTNTSGLAGTATAKVTVAAPSSGTVVVNTTPLATNHWDGTGTKTFTLTTLVDVPAGTKLVLSLGCSAILNTLSAFSVSDPSGLNWNEDGHIELSPAVIASVFSALTFNTLSAGTVITVTSSNALNRWNGIIRTATGTGTLDQVGMASATGSAISVSTSGTTATSGELIIGTYSFPAAATFTPQSGDGYDMVANATTTNKEVVATYRVGSTPAGIKTDSGTLSVGENWCGIITTYNITAPVVSAAGRYVCRGGTLKPVTQQVVRGGVLK